MRFGVLALGCVILLTCKGIAESPDLTNPEYVISRWETEDGLPENSATSMVQAPDGYLWFGTFNGLVRFDGLRFTVFDPGNTPEMPSPGVVKLHLDRHGRLWVGTLRGVVVREGSRWRLVHLAESPEQDYVLTFAERGDGAVLLTLASGRVIEVVEGRWSELPQPPGRKGPGYQGWADEEGRWWVVQVGFVGKWTGSEWVATLPDAGFPLAPRRPVGCAPARDGGLWLLVDTQLRKYAREVEVERRSMADLGGSGFGSFSSMCEDSTGTVWLCTFENGMVQVSPDGRVRRWTETDGLPYQDVRFVFEDRERNLWVGTSGGGLMRLKPRRVRVFGHDFGDPPLLVNAVAAAPGGGFWMATFGQGFFHVDQEGVTRRFRLPGWPQDNRFFETVLTDRRSRTWVGVSGEGLHVFDAAGGHHVPNEQTGGPKVRALFEDSLGRIWTSGGQGVAAFEDNSFRVYRAEHGAPEGSMCCFEETDDGRVWLSNLLGVFRFENGHFTEIRGAGGQALSGVTCFRHTRGGALWMGTLDRGLLRWREGSLDRVGSEAGLPVRGIYAIIEDEGGHFWMASSRGIVRAHRSELDRAAESQGDQLDCQVLGLTDGLHSVECANQRQPVATRDTAGRFWFATRKGMAMVDPSRFRLNPVPPPVHVEAISYELRPDPRAKGPAPLQRLDGPFVEPPKLPAGSRRIEIRYTAASFVAPENVAFQVKLDGHESDWHEGSTARAAYFHDLPPGDYVFRVRAANNDGVWNEAGASLAFTMVPYYWQTLWFRSGLGLGLASLGVAGAWWFSHARVRRALERARAAQEIRTLAGRLINAQEEERRRIARELHDDFSQRLALLSVEMELLESNPPGASSSSAPRSGEMAARVKDLSSEVHRLAYELHPAKLDHLGLVAAGRAFCRELARQSGLRITFEPGSFPRNVPPDLELCYYRVIQESLQNAVRHSGAQEARVELRAEADRLCLTISDSGRGFDVEQARQQGGLGLSSMQERVRHLRGKLVIESEPGRGTRLEVWVPWEHSARATP